MSHDRGETLILPLRAPRLWPPAFLAAVVCASVAAAMLIAAGLVGAPGSEAAARREALLLWGGLAGVLLFVLIGAAVGGRAREVTVTDAALIAPWTTGGRRRTLPLHRIRAVEDSARLGARGLLVAVSGSLPILLRDRDWLAPGDKERARKALFERVAAALGGEERLAFERRCATASAWRARPPQWPGLLLAGTALLALGFALELWIGPRLIEAGATDAGRLSVGDWQRLMAPVLLHANLTHLALNVLGIGLLIAWLAGGLGPWRTGVVLGAGAIAGNLASSVLGPPGLSVGASAAGYGLVGAVLHLGCFRRSEVPASLYVTLPLVLLLGVLLSSGLVTPHLDSAAHAGGLLGGALASALVTAGTPLAALPARTPGWVRGLAMALGVALLAAFARAVHLALAAPPAT